MDPETRDLPSPDAATLAAVAWLLDGTHLSTPDRLPGTVAEAGRALGWDVAVYLVTFNQRQLVPLRLPAKGLPTHDITQGAAGRAFRSVRTVTDGDVAWVPLLDGVERIGVLRIQFPEPAEDAITAPGVPEQIRWFSLLVGHLVSIVSAHGDTITLVRGGADRTLEAELLWNLLPPLTFACDRVVIAGLLEPSERVAGDAFDYAVDGDVATFALFDGSGHNLHSGLLTSVTVATYRSQRRHGADLAATARAIDEVLLAHTDGSGFATGVLAELNLDTGLLRFVNAGHPRPVLLRDGRFVKSLDHAGRPIFGLGDAAVTVGEERLRPGDQLVFYTDGITEARTDDGAFFGLDALIGLLERCAAERSPAPETLRLTVENVLAHQRGILQDDATILLVEWANLGGERLGPE
ncbi:PP2C family protein-serine/threonine phosphatase [Georgenia wangjunii]|uniref:PP2C family protein-serine/threonine phosphatase n=1 Tax=Georgenia wangjunii TaxID=3117730 RepID=UPI002F268365